VEKEIFKYGQISIKVIDELVAYAIEELLKFYLTNNHADILIDEDKLLEVNRLFSNHVFNEIKADLPKIIQLEESKILSALSTKISDSVTNPETLVKAAKFLEKERDFIYNKDKNWSSFESPFTYAKYDFDLLRYFSISDVVIQSIVDEKFQDIILNPIPQKGLISFTSFDSKVYHAILRNPNLLNAITWRNFEKLLANLLETFEYDVELLSGTKDGGIDIIAIKKDEHFGPVRFILQAKRWQNKVGVEPIRELAFLQHQLNATKACLVTTSHFTSGAWQLANMYKWQLELKDQDGLMDWLELAYKIKSNT
jgi:hypothetical protein